MLNDFQTSLSGAAEIIQAMALNAFTNNIKPQNVFVHGTYGVGKSAMFKQMVEFIEEQTGKEVVIIDKRLSAESEQTLLGMPYTSEVDGSSKKEMFYSTPEWFPRDPNKIYILFLDEFSNGSKDTQQAAYRLTLDREITNGRRLGDNVMIVAAGNLKSDKTGVKPILPAAANRFPVHIFIDKDSLAPDFIRHGIRSGFHDDVISYIAYDNDALIEESNGNMSIARSRTWEEVSKHMQNPFFNDRVRENAIRGTIGTGAASKFLGYLEHKDFLPDWEQVKKGKLVVDLDVSREVKFQLTMPLAREVIKALDEGNEQHIDNLCEVVNALDDELKVVYARFLKLSPNSVQKVMTNSTVLGTIKPVLDKI